MGKYVDVRNTEKHMYFRTFLKQQKKISIMRGDYLGQVGVIIWAKLVATKKWPTWPR